MAAFFKDPWLEVRLYPSFHLTVQSAPCGAIAQLAGFGKYIFCVFIQGSYLLLLAPKKENCLGLKEMHDKNRHVAKMYNFFCLVSLIDLLISDCPPILPLHKQINQAFTGQGWSQRVPCQPAVQVQDPSAGLHFAPLVQWQVALHPGPQVPSEQGVEQSGPCQPVDTRSTVSHL